MAKNASKSSKKQKKQLFGFEWRFMAMFSSKYFLSFVLKSFFLLNCFLYYYVIYICRFLLVKIYGETKLFIKQKEGEKKPLAFCMKKKCGFLVHFRPPAVTAC